MHFTHSKFHWANRSTFLCSRNAYMRACTDIGGTTRTSAYVYLHHHYEKKEMKAVTVVVKSYI